MSAEGINTSLVIGYRDVHSALGGRLGTCLSTVSATTLIVRGHSVLGSVSRKCVISVSSVTLSVTSVNVP